MLKITTIWIFLLFSFAIFATEKTKLDPVQKKYQPKIDYAQKQYRKNLENIKKLMIKDYQKYLNNAMRSKNLTLANKYQNKINSLKEGKFPEGTQIDEVVDFGIPSNPLAHNIVKAKWAQICGGTFEKEKNGDAELKGPGDWASGLAISLLDKRLKKNYTIAGEYKIEGTYGGFVLSFDKKKKSFAMLYSNAQATAKFLYSNPDKRTPAQILPMVWEYNKWTKFQITKKNNSYTIKNGTKSISIDLPDEFHGQYFGIGVHRATKMLIRNLKIQN